MLTRAKIVLCIAAALSTDSLAPVMAQDVMAQRVMAQDVMAQDSVFGAAGSGIQRKIAAGVDAKDRVSSAVDQTSHLTARYFDPNPAPSKAYTYAASVRLHPSSSKRIWLGELTFPAFNGTPTVSVQIISSISAMPMQVKSLKMVENPDSLDPVETRIVVEAEPIFDGVPSGFYFANLVVTGVPVSAPGQLGSAKLSN
jgi:hypothetical protein